MIIRFPGRSTIKILILGIALLSLVLPIVDAGNETSPEGNSTASISLENVMFDTDSAQHKVVVLTIRNVGGDVAQLDRIFINGKSFAKDIQIDPGKAMDISQNFDWRGYESYAVKLSGSDGLKANVTAISPYLGEEKDPGMLLLIIISFLIFASLILIGGWTPTKGNYFRFNLRHGQIRSAIAGTLIFGFVILTFFSLYYPLNENAIFNQFSQVVGIIIGFYFGSRTAASPGKSPTSKTGGKATVSEETLKGLQDEYNKASGEYEKKVKEEFKASEELNAANSTNDEGKKEGAKKALGKATTDKDTAKANMEKALKALESAKAEEETPAEVEASE